MSEKFDQPISEIEQNQETIPARIKVWDLLVRVLHWSLAISFVTGYVLDDQFPIHAYSGYVIFAIVLIRIVWGFIGTEYARFSSFIFSPGETLQYTFSAIKMGEAREYLSHNPMGALMVFMILILLLISTIMGMMLYGAQQLEGPFAGIVPVVWEDNLLLIHSALAQMLLALAIIHVLGVLWASWWHRQNYILAMLTGKKSSFSRRSKRRGAGNVWSEEERKTTVRHSK